VKQKRKSDQKTLKDHNVEERIPDQQDTFQMKYFGKKEKRMLQQGWDSSGCRVNSL
jgi:hypothetical protein